MNCELREGLLLLVLITYLPSIAAHASRAEGSKGE
jgi:hypothetical protein